MPPTFPKIFNAFHFYPKSLANVRWFCVECYVLIKHASSPRNAVSPWDTPQSLKRLSVSIVISLRSISEGFKMSYAFLSSDSLFYRSVHDVHKGVFEMEATTN